MVAREKMDVDATGEDVVLRNRDTGYPIATFHGHKPAAQSMARYLLACVRVAKVCVRMMDWRAAKYEAKQAIYFHDKENGCTRRHPEFGTCYQRATKDDTVDLCFACMKRTALRAELHQASEQYRTGLLKVQEQLKSTNIQRRSRNHGSNTTEG